MKEYKQILIKLNSKELSKGYNKLIDEIVSKIKSYKDEESNNLKDLVS